MKKGKRVIKLKKEYIEIIFAVFILICLFLCLLYVVFYKPKTSKNDSVDYIQLDDLDVDFSNSKCSVEDIVKYNEEAKKISITKNLVRVKIGEAVDFDSIEQTVLDSYGKVFDIKVNNMTENFYVIVKNDVTDEVKKITYDDFKDGVAEFQTTYTTDVTNYEVDVYLSNADCEGDIVRKFTFVAPVFNSFYEYDKCRLYVNFKYCQEYIYEEVPTDALFQYEFQTYRKQFNRTDEDDFISLIGYPYHSVEPVDVKDDKTDNVTTKIDETDNDNVLGNFDKYKVIIVISTICVLISIIIIPLIIIKKKAVK